MGLFGPGFFRVVGGGSRPIFWDPAWPPRTFSLGSGTVFVKKMLKMNSLGLGPPLEAPQRSAEGGRVRVGNQSPPKPQKNCWPREKFPTKCRGYSPFKWKKCQRYSPPVVPIPFFLVDERPVDDIPPFRKKVIYWKLSSVPKKVFYFKIQLHIFDKSYKTKLMNNFCGFLSF